MSDQKETISNNEDTKATVTKRPWVTPILHDLSAVSTKSGTMTAQNESSATTPSDYAPNS